MSDDHKVGALALLCLLLILVAIIAALTISAVASGARRERVKRAELVACQRLPDPTACVANVIGQYNVHSDISK